MKGLFKRSVEAHAERMMSIIPTSQTGWGISTAKVALDLIDNPFYRSLNGMTLVDSPQPDGAKTGVSVIVRRGKDEKIFINPKFSGSPYGSDSGKDADMSMDDKQLSLLDIVYSGQHLQTPTIIGMTMTNKNTPTGQYTPRDFSTNTPAGVSSGKAPLQGKIGLGGTTTTTDTGGEVAPFNPLGDGVEVSTGISNGVEFKDFKGTRIKVQSDAQSSIEKSKESANNSNLSWLPNIINSKGQVVVPAYPIDQNIQGQNAKTGTYLLDTRNTSKTIDLGYKLGKQLLRFIR